MQGRWQDEHMDPLALAYWLFGMIRNECRNPTQAMQVLMHIICFIYRKYPQEKTALVEQFTKTLEEWKD